LHFKSSNVTTTQNLALSADSFRQKTNQTLTLWINSIGRKHHLRFLITQLDPSRTPILQEKISVQSIQPDQKECFFHSAPNIPRAGVFFITGPLQSNRVKKKNLLVHLLSAPARPPCAKPTVIDQHQQKRKARFCQKKV
jgi:hypothetical protein